MSTISTGLCRNAVRSCVLLLAMVIQILAPCSQVFAERSATEKPLYKTTYPVIDFHHHTDTPDLRAVEANLEVFEALGIDKLAMLDGNWTTGTLLEWVEIYKQHPDRLILFANVNFSKVDEPNFSQDLVTEVIAQKRLGVQAIKIYKALGLFVRDRNEKLLAVDDERLDPYWAKCGELGLPVLIHTADPKEYFFPRTYNSFHYGVPNHDGDRSDRVKWEQFGEPEYWKDSSLPKFDDLLTQRDHVLAKHPETTFVGAHMGSLTFDLERLGKTLDKYPNFYVDSSARLRILGRLNPHAVRDFFIKYQDRILYASDFTSLMNTDPDDADAVAEWKERAKHLYGRHLEYFETDHTDIIEPFGHQEHWLRLAGVKLPPEVLKKFYYFNAIKLIPSLQQYQRHTSR